MTSIALANDAREVVVRLRASDCQQLQKHLFQRYPLRECGTFFRFGWRRTSWGIALTYVDGMWPLPGDMDRQTNLATFKDTYIRRAFRAGKARMGVGLALPIPTPRATELRRARLMTTWTGISVVSYRRIRAAYHTVV